MKCHEAKRALDLFMDGELPVPENARVLEHLGLCRPCGEVYEGEKALRAGLKASLETAPPGLVDRLFRAAAAPPGPPPLRAVRWAAALLFGAFVLALVFTAPAEMAHALASEAAAKHDALDYVCGSPGEGPDRRCICSGCCGDSEAGEVSGFFAEHGRPDFCSHGVLAKLGYRCSGVAAWEHRGEVLGWSTHRDGRGRTVSHALIRSPVAAPPVHVAKARGRTVVFHAMPEAGRTCVFVFDDAAEADRFLDATGLGR
jgi:anti-sigma factor RsiW